MNMDDSDLIERLNAVAEGFEMPPTTPSDDVWRGRRRVRRTQALVAGAAAAAVAVIVGITAVLSAQERTRSDELEPVDTPTVVQSPAPAVDAVPVWYDAAGLHHGDVVEKTPVELIELEDPEGYCGDECGPVGGGLALVRSGAVYLDPATGDVWLHPWGGEPRIVGHDSDGGPGGDPQGDIAVWFEGSDLVLYDTAAGRQISRTREAHGLGGQIGAENYPFGTNGFLEVSAGRVIWRSDGPVVSHDVLSGDTVVVKGGWDVEVDGGTRRVVKYLVDLQGDVGVSVEPSRDPRSPLLRLPDRTEHRLPDIGTHLRLSTTGNYVLGTITVRANTAAEDGAAAIVDTRTRELWQLPGTGYPTIAWAYGDIAVVGIGAADDKDSVLLACDATKRSCEVLDTSGPALVPTN